ncbi:aminotransferase class V-fold PLP-dependent enzyme [Metamycoplasma equirhinis]|uniref:aminotransferase class V-fold PLP-dependent enzyme n=1 Tax=Metamycoplasma equirhinis TaxID=92402 RepID=UPI0035944B5B
MKSEFKKYFPMFLNNPNIVYFDNAALTFKSQSVIDSGTEFYEKYSISTRTADSELGIKISQKLAIARESIANFVDAKGSELIFTSGTTESLNLIASMLSDIIDDGEIILTYFNHSSNIVPYLENFKEKNISIKYCETEEDILTSINRQTKIVALAQANNNFSVKYNLDKIYSKCKKYNAILINDAAQAIAHEKVSLKNGDVIAFSSNKIFGPTGMGALIIKSDLLEKLSPKKFGGGQVQNIGENFNWNSHTNITKFEPGTPNFAGIFQFQSAIEFLKLLDYKKINTVENKLANYIYEKLSEIPNLFIASNKGDKIVLFNIKNIPAQDIASYLGHNNIYVRSGIFCAHKFKSISKYESSYVRISLSIYNDFKDVDMLIEKLKKVEVEYLDFL